MSRPASMRDRGAWVAVVGPTGSGKSALALALARAFPAEVVGCDALQVYRGLDLGTAKLTPEERGGVPHHLLDVVEPDAEFSAARYIELAAPAVRSISRRRKLPIVVGGTGLYLRALRRGLFPGPGRSPELRERLSRIVARGGSAKLHGLLARMDRVSAERVHPSDRARLVRALEVALLTGRPMSELMELTRSPVEGFQAILLGLAPGREALAARIERRVQRMFDSGFVEEVRRLRARFGKSGKFGKEIPAFKAIGYREVLAALDGACDLDHARAMTVRATLQYAKRQMTWFRKEEGIHWLAGAGEQTHVQQQALAHLTESLARPTKDEPTSGQRRSESVHAETAS